MCPSVQTNFALDISHNMVFEITDLFHEKVTRSFEGLFFLSR